MQISLAPGLIRLVILTFISVLMVTSQGLAGFAICVGQPGHVEIEFANSACCNPVSSNQDQVDELIEAEGPDCGACRDHEIATRSLLHRGGHSSLVRPTQQSLLSDMPLLSDIAPDAVIIIVQTIFPDHLHRVKLIIEKTLSPLRC